jgi:hypothetical protein
MELNGPDTAQFPLIVMKHPATALANEGRYMVVCGNHRLLAMKAINESKDSTKRVEGAHCIVIAPKNDEERIFVAVSKALIRFLQPWAFFGTLNCRLVLQRATKKRPR